MSTRAIIVVTGENRIGPRAVRLYKHSDGYPTDTLADLVTATERAEGYITTRGQDLTIYTQDCSVPALKDMPPPGFAAQVTTAGFYWHGSAYRVDEVFPSPDGTDIFGDQGDLEWVYHVNLTTRTITVWGGGYGAPEEHFARGPVHPWDYADGLLPEYRQDEKTAIAAHMDKLMDQGWTIIAKVEKKRPRKTKAN